MYCREYDDSVNLVYGGFIVKLKWIELLVSEVISKLVRKKIVTLASVQII